MQNKLEKSFILHQRPFSESSLMIDVLTEEAGRLTVIAKGAKRPKSYWRGILVPFKPLSMTWVGRSDLKTLTLAEPDGKGWVLAGTLLWCGLYVNELIMRLLSPFDPHPDIFSAYGHVIAGLAIDPKRSEQHLRRFERDLLSSLGYGIEYREAKTDQAIVKDVMYEYDPVLGFLPLIDEGRGRLIISGASILALEQGIFEDARQLKETKMILKVALASHLGNKPLQTRQLFKEVQSFF